ncbi:hypothetical protein QAD02_010162 [Eretmocerus hayati]|uniref:Uncharacterized protein n=1 Tax=Eretmocerus hayati TaxID=131215 RepID=A0ACC2NBB1_9HYME|nr:hypothetical protein QAD02_010162 [Eretmocerus hayati]
MVFSTHFDRIVECQEKLESEEIFFNPANRSSQENIKSSALELALYNGDKQLREAGLFGTYPHVKDVMPNNCAMQILRHANLMLSENQFVDSRYLHLRKAENEKCQAELKELRTEILGYKDGNVGGKTTSLYELLVNGKSRFYSRKSEIMQKLQDPEYMKALLARFPIYGDKILQITEYLNLQEMATEILSQFIGVKRDGLPSLIEKILGMLLRKHVRALFQA